MTAQAGMTARATYEQSCCAAITRYQASLDEMARKPAYARLIDDLLKAGDRYIGNATRERVIQAIADSRLAASRRASLDDELSAVNVRQRRTAGAR
jgi:hypothetical protein